MMNSNPLTLTCGLTQDRLIALRNGYFISDAGRCQYRKSDNSICNCLVTQHADTVAPSKLHYFLSICFSLCYSYLLYEILQFCLKNVSRISISHF